MITEVRRSHQRYKAALDERKNEDSDKNRKSILKRKLQTELKEIQAKKRKENSTATQKLIELENKEKELLKALSSI